ncbi:MAG TPA: UPF0175 family protein [Sphingobacterium sp.]|nr:UPF0175 family protein [Sphingobacterium sp.]
MAKTISIDYPEHLANSMRMNKDDFGRQIKESALVKLFEIGKVSSGTAAKVLEMSRIEFLELLNKYKVGFLNVDDLEEDLNNA